MVKAMISDFTIKSIKDLPITSILEKEGIEFKRIGKEAVTLCPWHNDKNPSLTLSDEKGLCFCFVCQIGADAIGFMQQKLGLTFSESIERIAFKNDIILTYEDIDPELAAQEAKRRAQFSEQLNNQQKLFRSLLKDTRASRIRQFLDDRKILPSTSKYFELGYASTGFFADRITVPIHDHIGSLIGFTGRITREDIKPKYKNSENNDYFDKSRIVFNEHRASAAIKESDSIVFVEGHFDVISLWQYGIANVVAMQGTVAPSEAVLSRLSKKTKRFILCYDSDEGGKKAIEQFIKVAGPLACRGEISISIAHLPESTDPDQCIRDNLVDMFSVIENSSPWLDWQLDVWLSSVDRSDTARFTQIEAKVKELINSIQSPVLRQHYIDKASKLLALDAAAAIKVAKSWNENLSKININKTWNKPTPIQTKMSAERKLLRIYIHFKELRVSCKDMMNKLETPSYRWLWKRILEIEIYAPELNLRLVLLSVLVVSEPHYVRQLRPILNPTVNLSKQPGIMDHIRLAMANTMTTSEI